MFKLGVIFEATLLLINAIAILNEERFLARIGWVSPSRQIREGNAYQQGYDQNGYGGGQAELGIKARLIDLISAVRTLMRIPLIAINTLVILYELVIP